MITKILRLFSRNALIIFKTINVILLAGCSPSAVAPSDNVDDWKPPEGIEAISPFSCEQVKRLFDYDAQAPLDFREEKRQREEGLTVIEFSYASPSGGRVPAILVVPDGAGPFAGLVLMHGSGGSRRSLLSLAQAYARLGAVSILISAPFARLEHNSGQAFTFQEQDRREQVQLIVDLRRAIDILLARPEVDPQRLAYVGISYGGAMGGLLAGMETRLHGYVFQVGYGGPVNRFSESSLRGLPEEQRRKWLAWMWPIEPIHYVGCAAPAALLFQNGTQDASVPPARALRYQRAGSEPKTILWYEAGHDLPLRAYQDQAEWLRGIIGITNCRMAFPRSVQVALAAWVLLTAACAVLLIWDLRRIRNIAPGAWMMWLLTIIFLGPFGLVVYWVSFRQALDGRKSTGQGSLVRRAFGSAAWAAAGNLVGGVVVLALLIQLPVVFGENRILLTAVAFLIPFGTGWLLAALFRRLSHPASVDAFDDHLPVIPEAVSTCLVLIGVYPFVNILSGRWFGRWAVFGFDLSYPPLWGAFCLGAIAGVLIAFPFHLWMIRRGVIRWCPAETVDAVAARPLPWALQAALVALSLVILLAVILLSARMALGG